MPSVSGRFENWLARPDQRVGVRVYDAIADGFRWAVRRALDTSLVVDAMLMRAISFATG